MPHRRRLGIPCLLLGLGALACSSNPVRSTADSFKPRPVIQARQYARFDDAMSLVAVMPFLPSESLSFARPEPGDVDPIEAAEQVSHFVSEALAAKGVKVIPAQDVNTAFAGAGVITPRGDVKSAVQAVSDNFGAKGVILGTVSRYHDRVGTKRAGEPASVSFELTLYSVPEGRKLWQGRFIHSQPTLNENPISATRYPGGGTRWLTAAELARWGARESAEAMLASP